MKPSLDFNGLSSTRRKPLGDISNKASNDRKRKNMLEAEVTYVCMDTYIRRPACIHL
jgi:hypothetical protein